MLLLKYSASPKNYPTEKKACTAILLFWQIELGRAWAKDNLDTMRISDHLGRESIQILNCRWTFQQRYNLPACSGKRKYKQLVTRRRFTIYMEIRIFIWQILEEKYLEMSVSQGRGSSKRLKLQT